MYSSAHTLQSVSRTPHSLVLVSAGCVLFLLCVLYSSPVYLISLLFFTMWGAQRLGKAQQWRRTFGVCLLLWAAVILINALVSVDGATVLYVSRAIPGWGPIRLTFEALVFGFTMGLKLTLIICVCRLYGFWIGSDRSFSVLNRMAPQSSILLSLSVLLVPRLRRRLEAAYGALKGRGAGLGAASWRSRIRTSCLLLRVMLSSALEDSWAAAEALHSRGYGCQKRSTYDDERWRVRDSALLCLVLVLAAVSLARFSYGGGTFNCYPEISLSDSIVDCLVIAFQLLVFGTLISANDIRRRRGRS